MKESILKIIVFGIGLVIFFITNGCGTAAPTTKTVQPPVSIPVPSSDPSPITNPTQAVEQGSLIEIGYDTGISSGTLAMRSNGYSVRYAPDCIEFVIKRVKVYGNLYGEEQDGKYAELRITDQNFQVLYSSTIEYKAFNMEASWVSIDVDNVLVSGPFYVFLQTNSQSTNGISVSYDSSFSNEESNIIYNWNLADWAIYMKDRPKQNYNWMIRVIGTSTSSSIPVTYPLPRQTVDWSTMCFEETLKLLDNPDKLSFSMLNNMTYESHYEQWRETGITYRAIPKDIFDTKIGCCAEFAIFACYVLEFHGYDSEILTIGVASDPSKGHAVCVYHPENSLYTIDLGKIKGPFETYEDIAFAHHRNWSSYEIYYSWDKYQLLGEPNEIVRRIN